jgi:hypothetical protein
MQNPQTRLGKILYAILWLTVLTIAVWNFIERKNEQKKNEQREYIDSLFHASEQSITFDSIRSVFDQKLFDSLRVIRQSIDVERSTRKRETQRLRNDQQKLRHRIDSIGPIDRPNF